MRELRRAVSLLQAAFSQLHSQASAKHCLATADSSGSCSVCSFAMSAGFHRPPPTSVTAVKHAVTDLYRQLERLQMQELHGEGAGETSHSLSDSHPATVALAGSLKAGLLLPKQEQQHTTPLQLGLYPSRIRSWSFHEELGERKGAAAVSMVRRATAAAASATVKGRGAGGFLPSQLAALLLGKGTRRGSQSEEEGADEESSESGSAWTSEEEEEEEGGEDEEGGKSIDSDCSSDAEGTAEQAAHTAAVHAAEDVFLCILSFITGPLQNAPVPSTASSSSLSLSAPKPPSCKGDFRTLQAVASVCKDWRRMALDLPQLEPAWRAAAGRRFHCFLPAVGEGMSVGKEELVSGQSGGEKNEEEEKEEENEEKTEGTEGRKETAGTRRSSGKKRTMAEAAEGDTEMAFEAAGETLTLKKRRDAAGASKGTVAIKGACTSSSSSSRWSTRPLLTVQGWSKAASCDPATVICVCGSHSSTSSISSSITSAGSSTDGHISVSAMSSSPAPAALPPSACGRVWQQLLVNRRSAEHKARKLTQTAMLKRSQLLSKGSLRLGNGSKHFSVSSAVISNDRKRAGGAAAGGIAKESVLHADSSSPRAAMTSSQNSASSSSSSPSLPSAGAGATSSSRSRAAAAAAVPSWHARPCQVCSCSRALADEASYLLHLQEDHRLLLLQ